MTLKYVGNAIKKIDENGREYYVVPEDILLKYKVIELRENGEIWAM